MNEELYKELNKSWNSTCRVLFGEELGDLNDYTDCLREHVPIIKKRKSHISGKDVSVEMEDYVPSARFVSAEESKEIATPLNINEIKDIDSIVEAVKERWEYCGNKVIGNSVLVESSDSIENSQYVADSVHIQSTSHAFASYSARESKHIFGSGNLGSGEFYIGLLGGQNNKRCYYSSIILNSSDIYLSHNCFGCHDLMFSFHQINKRNCIGNLELPKEKYNELKAKLLKEIADEARKTKEFPSIYKILPNERPNTDISLSVEPDLPRGDSAPMEKAFTTTYKILFKNEPGKFTDYENWLAKHTVPLTEIKSPFGSSVYLPKSSAFRMFELVPEKRLVTYNEGIELGKLQLLPERDVGNYEEIKKWMADNLCYSPHFAGGLNRNIIESPIVHDSVNIYKSSLSIQSENVGVNSRPLSSKYLFGCHQIKHSLFSINCYNSDNLNRCFEVNTSVQCSDSMFCHNSEGLTDSMFCFNTKGKRHAIGNTPLPPNQYKDIKDSVIQQMADELNKNKYLRWDIFNIGCK